MKHLLLFLLIVLAACHGSPGTLSDTGPEAPVQPEQEAGISDTLIESIYKAQSDLGAGIPRGTILGVIGISSQEESIGEFAEEQLIFFLVQSGEYRIVERRDLDVIRTEQNLHLSGEVDDATAVSIGRLAGAGIVITGSIIQLGPASYLNLRALDVETAQIRAVSSRPFVSLF